MGHLRVTRCPPHPAAPTPRRTPELRADPTGALLLVGDTDQLPPVGPGLPIAAALAEGMLPSIDLRQIYRSAANSAIVTSAHAINQGEGRHCCSLTAVCAQGWLSLGRKLLLSPPA
jgi:hypothetical protein